MERKNAWDQYTGAELAALEAFAGNYRDFLSSAKTERECVNLSIRLAEAQGFEDMRGRAQARPGDRLYLNWRGKSLLLFVLGSEPLEQGMRILGAHIDSPRLDVKQYPLYEEAGLAYLDTHYYGGIKKYQWVARPLALHGVVVKKDGSTIELCIGEAEDDPVFCITDLLPHLDMEQRKREVTKLVAGEDLDILIANRPLSGGNKEAVQANVLRLLEARGISEEDFLSAELEIVPAGRARDMGLDRSMILGYGNDDRVCAYPSLRAVTDFEGTPRHTLCALLTDKEEIGSTGATGMDGFFFENAVAELCAMAGETDPRAARHCLMNSRMLSSDVSAAYDPLYPFAFEKRNAAYLSRGLCLSTFTGSRGKSGSSHSNAEFVAYLRRVFDEAGVTYHFAEIGKVDMGGGGTIARFCARYGMEIIDAGVPVLSMHAPNEVISKADIWEAYKGYCAFLK